MGPKLGEILIAGRHLSPADLKKALDAQLVFGGRLGTNLLDLGLLDEETLTRVLEEQKRVAVATPKMLEEADPMALRLVPAKLATRHSAIPFALGEHDIRVAMLDPTDLVAADEIGFASGRAVIAYIAPEIRIEGYLERYYGVPRPVRHSRGPADDRHGHAGARTREAPARAEVAPQAASPSAHAPTLPAPETAEEGDLSEVARRLAEADTREEIGEALMLIARQEFPRAFAWLIQRDRALGWLAHAPGVAPQAARAWARQAVVPLNESSVLADVVSGKRYYLGELSSRPVDELLATLFGEPKTRDLVLIPVILADQVIIVLQGDGGGKPLASFDLKALRSACQKASDAMEILLMRARIRQV